MSIPALCTFCKKARIANQTQSSHNVTVEYECGSNSVYGLNPVTRINVSVLNNKCTFIPPPGVSDNPDDWTDFYKTEAYESSAYSRHLDMMGDRFEWLHELGDAYKTIIENLTNSQPLKPEALLLMQTCITCRTELITAFRALARGYSRDCRLKTRLAVEYAIFSARAVEKPSTVESWLAAANSDKDWKRYKDNFKIYYLLEKDDAWKTLAKLKPQLHRLADDYAHLSQFTHATVLSAGSWASGAKILFATAFVERFIEQHFLSIFAELIDIHLNIINLIVKLAQVLNIEVDSGIFELVKLLEKDVNNLKETIDAFLELALKDETPTMESPGGI